MNVLVINGSPKGEEMIKKASEPILPNRAFKTLVNNYWESCN